MVSQEKLRYPFFRQEWLPDRVKLMLKRLKADNSVITEPVLADGGRKAVISNSLVTERLEDTTEEISMVSGDFNLNQMEKKEYYLNMRDYIKKNNPSGRYNFN